MGLNVAATRLGLGGIAAVCLLSASTHACTRYLSNADGRPVVVARSMDLFTNDKATMAVFPREMPRTSHSAQAPIAWTSRYGSVAITGLGIATTDGVNERGLAANALYLGKTQYQQPDGRRSLDVGSWAQYVLDNYATVHEALDGLEKIRIAGLNLGGMNWPVHLAIEDASGDSAVIEYVNGVQKIHHGREFTVMTNEPELDVQLANIKRYKPFGGALPLPGDIDPMSRFVRVAAFAKTSPAPTSGTDAVALVAGLLRTASVPKGSQDYSGNEDAADTWQTRWFTAADLTSRKYYFQSMTSPNAFWVDLTKIDFTPGRKSVQIDAYDPTLSGDVSGRF